MRDVESGHRRVQICPGTGEEIPGFKESAMTCVQEVVNHLDETLGRSVEACTRPNPPWAEGRSGWRPRPNMNQCQE
jgi:hypothetical protein